MAKVYKKSIEFEYSYYKLGTVLSKIDIQWREQTAQGDLTQFSLKLSIMLQICSDENGIIRGLITKEYFGEIKA